MEDLTLFEALTGGAFDRLNWQHSGELDQNFSKKSNAPGVAREDRQFWNWPVHNCRTENTEYSVCSVCTVCTVCSLHGLRFGVTDEPFSKVYVRTLGNAIFANPTWPVCALPSLKDLITWARLAQLAGLLLCAEMTFSPILHEASQPCWWLMRWNAGDQSELEFGAKKALLRAISMARSCRFQNGHYKNAANDCNCLSQQLAVLSSSFMQLDRLLNDPANAITWKNLSPVSRDPGISANRASSVIM